MGTSGEVRDREVADQGDYPPLVPGRPSGLQHGMPLALAADVVMPPGGEQLGVIARQVGRKYDREHGQAVYGLPGAPAGCKRLRQLGPASAPGLPHMMPPADEVSPQEYLHRILKERGYETELMPASRQTFFHPPTVKQVEDYDLALVTAVKRGDLEMVKQLAGMGRGMDACNKHGESIVHISCRRGHVELLRFLLENGGQVDTCDDLGRTPLHDACWAKTPVFECVVIILERNLGLLRVVDCRGASPLQYVKREHWTLWRQFFDMKKEQYWAPRTGSASASASVDRASTSEAPLARQGLPKAATSLPAPMPARQVPPSLPFPLHAQRPQLQAPQAEAQAQAQPQPQPKFLYQNVQQQQQHQHQQSTLAALRLPGRGGERPRPSGEGPDATGRALHGGALWSSALGASFTWATEKSEAEGSGDRGDGAGK